MDISDVIVFGGAGLIALLILGNYSHCTEIAKDSGTIIVDANGKQVFTTDGVLLPPYTSNPCGAVPNPCRIITPSTARPSWDCLLSLFPGGL
jgi:hypothetical protein